MGYKHVNHRNFSKPSRLETFSRNVLVGLNTIFVVFGFILIVYGIGGNTSTNRSSYLSITENGGDLFQFTSNILIILGVFSLLIGLWGLSGIFSYSKAAVYISLLMVLICLDLFWGYYSTVMEETAKISVENNLLSSLEKLKNVKINPNSTLMTTRQNWDALQSELKCCGVYEYRDWYLPKVFHRISDKMMNDVIQNQVVNKTASNHYASSEDYFRIPQSCFKNGDDGLVDADYNVPVQPEDILENIFTEGCLHKTVIDLDIDRMQRVGVLMACFKILAVLSALIVTCHLKSDADDFSSV